jgi:hypothetical protein
MACNRDELRTRPPATPPEVRTYGPARAILPIDPVSAGTWIAVNDFGLALALLNVYLPATGSYSRVPKRSRGTIIPELVESQSFESCVRRALAVNPRLFAPFRLIIAGQATIAEIRSDGRTLHSIQWIKAAIPMFFTSSGLGDHLVENPRRQLFDQFFAASGDWHAVQDGYHRHFWPEQRHLSVCMCRDDAHTVSYSVISVNSTNAALTYHAEAPDIHAARTTLQFPLQLERRR